MKFKIGDKVVLKENTPVLGVSFAVYTKGQVGQVVEGDICFKENIEVQMDCDKLIWMFSVSDFVSCPDVNYEPTIPVFEIK